MVTVKFLGPINKDDLKIDIKSLLELKQILQDDAELENILSLSSVAVNGHIISDLNQTLKHGDEIAILPPVCGG